MSGASLSVGAATRRSLVQEVRAYWAVTDPRTVALLVFTGFAAGLAAGGLQAPGRLILICLALALSSMGARAVANYIDRDVDALMERTRRRPLPRGLIAPSRALALGLALIGAGLLVAAPFGPAVVLLIALGLADNLLVYARLTKRTNPLSIVMGAPSGGAPALVGYVAVAGSVNPVAVALAMFVVLWTPIHIWSLAIRYCEDYARAGIRMMPVVVGLSRSAAYVGYASIALAIWTVLYVVAAGSGLLPPIAVFVVTLGLALLVGSFGLVRRPTAANAWRLFKFTAPYLAVLFAVVALNGILTPR